MRHVQQSQVTLFLTLFKEFSENVFSFYPREEGLGTIAYLGITIPQAKEEILGLTYENYYRGPIPDKDREGEEYWEFGKTISGKQVFIKLKTVSEHNAAICFAFHIPKEQMEYPFESKRREK